MIKSAFWMFAKVKFNFLIISRILVDPPNDNLECNTGDALPEVTVHASRNKNCHIHKQPGDWLTACPLCNKSPLSKQSSWQQHNLIPLKPPTLYFPVFVAPNMYPYLPYSAIFLSIRNPLCPHHL
ncbi:putative signal peptide protein [Puccinia sorghi]|uniref:Putative signal peptide protein n=1 Tax=Puccinia sorghi TaxID=27349 RepID=A0A0L6VEV8_9BASI|nr:putative signal peptide protein [Puccinia sorghi]